jgi:hypothetical protein
MKCVRIGLTAIALLSACGGDGDDKAPSVGALQDEFAASLRKCNLIGEGKVQAVPYEVDGQNPKAASCQSACLDEVYGNCEELETLACSGRRSDRFNACLSECAKIELRCTDGSGSYRIDERCDAEAQCDDRSDEKGCFPVTGICDDGELILRGGSSAGLGVICNGVDDCSGGEDEAGCPAPAYCANGDAIPFSEMCDGEDYCADGEDEKDCSDAPVGGGFECADKSYSLPREAVCDLAVQCPDGSDEKQGCAELKCEPSVTCRDVPPGALCDGVDDCLDGSDERNCEDDCDSAVLCDGYDDGCSDEVGCDDDCDPCDGIDDGCGDEIACDDPSPCDSPVLCDGFDEGCGYEIGCDVSDPCDSAVMCDGFDEGCGDEIGCDVTDPCDSARLCDGVDEGCGDEIGCDDPDPCDSAGLCDGFDEGCGDELDCEVTDPCDSAGLCDGFDEGCGDEIGCEP